MTPEELEVYCLAKPGAWRDEPWEGDGVAKVGPKIFAFLGAESVGVKCARTREAADEWLQRYPDDASVMAYIGRSGWNTLRLLGSIPDEELREAIDTSYELVVSGLPKKGRPPAGDTPPRDGPPPPAHRRAPAARQPGNRNR
jgi:predicted DNA-binding protein (MmcQ/YjbR family)